MLAKVENNRDVLQESFCGEGSVARVSMNGDALDGVARGRGVTLVDETCKELELEHKWM